MALLFYDFPKTYFVYSFIIVICYITLVYPITNGKLFDSKGHPLAGATIVTTGSHLQAISDFDGTFRLSAATHANLSNSRVLNNFCTIKGALVFLELPFSSLVHIELFNLGGAKLKGEFKKWLSSGSYKYDLFQICNASNGIYIAKTQVGKAVSLFKIIKVNHTHLPFPNKSTSSFASGFLGKTNADEPDSVIVTCNGYETKSMPFTASTNTDSLTLNTFSYSSNFYNGSYRISNDTLSIWKRPLDTVTTYCQYWGYVGAPPNGLVREIAPVDSTSFKYWIRGDTLNLVVETDTCMRHKAFTEDTAQPCIDTVPASVDIIQSFTRNLPDTGLGGFWSQSHYSYNVTRGSLDSNKRKEYDWQISNDNAYTNTWRESNKLFIFQNGNYYERSLAQYDFADGVVQDWRTCQSPIPINSNTGIQVDSCQYDISVSPIDSISVLLIGNISKDSVFINRLINDDLVLKSSNKLFGTAIMKQNPDSCPDTISWYLNFRAANMR